MHKSTLPRFNRNNCKEALGMEFKFYDEGSDTWCDAFIAGFDLDKGVTVKDLDNADGEMFLFCFSIEWYERNGMYHYISDAQDVILAIINHIHLKGETTFNTLMWHFDTHGKADDLWDEDVDVYSGTTCPF